jgi:hypothetical protein
LFLTAKKVSTEADGDRRGWWIFDDEKKLINPWEGLSNSINVVSQTIINFW